MARLVPVDEDQKKPSARLVPVDEVSDQPAPSGFVKGLLDPFEGGAQLLEKALPSAVSDKINQANNWLARNTGLVPELPEGVSKAVQQREAAYQSQRKEGGIDWPRMAGNLLSPANIAIASKIPVAASAGKNIMMGAGIGAGQNALNPVSSDDFLEEKAKQIAFGAAGGAIVPAALSGVAAMVKPNVSQNAKLLMGEGVKPTTGQLAGGRLSVLEDKMTSLPIIGDAITNRRSEALQQFNLAAINRATAPLGVKIEKAGQEGVKEAGDLLSNAYDDVLGNIKAVKFDGDFMQNVANLNQMTSGLPDDIARTFEKKVNAYFGNRLSPSQGMTAETFKQADSDIGRLASVYSGSSDSVQRELGAAFRELQSLMRQQVGRSNPEYSEQLSKINQGYANLVRVEAAAKQAKNNEGLFTPAQLNNAIQQSDKSVRKRAVSRGEALMQDLANAGQQVIGNKTPNSFTADRALIAGGALGSAYINPLIPAGLIGSAALYTKPGQTAINYLTAGQRGKGAEVASNLIRNMAPYGIPIGGASVAGLLNQ